jgi:hypothetical protein
MVVGRFACAFSGSFLTQGWFRQSGVISSRLVVDWRSRVETHQPSSGCERNTPQGHNAHRWAANYRSCNETLAIDGCASLYRNSVSLW